MTLSDEESRGFQMAVGSAQAMVMQSLSHVESSTKKLSDRIERASTRSPMGRDIAASQEGKYQLALQNRVQHVETASNAIIANLNGLRLLLSGDTFYALPCISVARSVAETAATVGWLLDGRASVEDRAVRSYAAMFRSIDQGIANSLPDDAAKFRDLRKRIILGLSQQGVHVMHRTKGDTIFDDIALVRTGDVQAKTAFQYTQRINAEIPALAGLYSNLSGMAHGEQVHASATYDRPDSVARLLALAVVWAVEGWSRAVHGWVGVTAGPFINPRDHATLIASVPDDVARSINEQAAPQQPHE